MPKHHRFGLNANANSRETWIETAQKVEALGYYSLLPSDHLNDQLGPIAALVAAAEATSTLRLGSYVFGNDFRHPVFLARQAAAINDLSGGWLILGLGAGWREEEHTMFGYELGDIPTRMDRLGEGLAVGTGLLRNEEPLTYEGQFYQLHQAKLAGPRRAGGPAILVGGSGPRRTLPLVARYADIWNGQQLSPPEYGERSALLDKLLAEVGRQPGEVKRTLTLPLFCGRDETELEQRAGWLRPMNPEWADVPLETIFAALRPRFKSLTVGTPEEVVERLRAYAAVGITEVMLQWGGLDDIEGLKLLSEEVLLYLAE